MEVSTTSDPFQRLATLLTERGIAFVREMSSLTVRRLAPTGFDLTLHDDRVEWTVELDGAHVHFDSAEDALQCFLFALTPRCRVRVTEWGGVPSSWAFQASKDGRWESWHRTWVLVFPFWRRRATRVFQNDFPGADGG